MRPDFTTGYQMEARSSTGRLSISLVVSCYTLDRYEDLVRLIASIEAQTEPVDQVVFVVQQSQALAERLRADLDASAIHRHAEVHFLEEAGVSRARNLGVQRAKGDIIAFTDDDASLCPDWAEETRRAYRDYPGSIGIAGAVLPLWDAPAMDWFPRELYWMLSCTYWDATGAIPVRNGYGVNISFRREAFEGRRFDESLGVGAWATGAWRGVGGEEPEFCVRLRRETGRGVLYVPDVRVWHRVRAYRLAPGTIVRRAYWEGRFKAILEQMGDVDAPVLGTERALLQMIADNSVARLRDAVSRPGTALKQQAIVSCAVTSVLCGYAEGRARRLVHAKSRQQSRAMKPPEGECK